MNHFKYLGSYALELADFGLVEPNQIVEFDGGISGVDWEPVEAADGDSAR